ncbi:hypothetical protein SAY86_000109 [Trapa natans]|uniref:Uncharacterized protein n=1 Tax=Trapa natans TaxID=22666 RepID=A0AAN7MWX8_TRANT|nr:hypothetical protein SAY86_000109 [Trapa natans]
MISATLMRKRRGRFQLDEDKGSSTPFPSINQNPLYSRHERNYVAVEADSDDDPPPGALHVFAEQTPQDKYPPHPQNLCGQPCLANTLLLPGNP